MNDLCKFPGCNNLRPAGRGYCCNAHYMVHRGHDDARKREQAHKEKARRALERASNPRMSLADRLFPHMDEEWERDEAMSDLIELVQAEARWIVEEQA